MCSVCGLPATHTGAATVFVLYAVPIFIAYFNAWFLTSRLYPIFNKASQKTKLLSGNQPWQLISKSWLPITIFVITATSPYVLEWLFWNGSDAVFYFINATGPRVLAGATCAAGSFILLTSYQFETKLKLKKHLAILLAIESLLMSLGWY